MIDRIGSVATFGLALVIASVAAPQAKAQGMKEIESPGAAKHHPKAYRTDTVEVALLPTKDPRRGNEVEFSIRMKAGDALVYSVQGPAGQDVYHEFHGHDADRVSFYKKASGDTHHGSLVAPFDGLHGWYFDNRSAQPAKVQLRLSGFYELIPAGEEGNSYGIEPLPSAQPK